MNKQRRKELKAEIKKCKAFIRQQRYDAVKRMFKQYHLQELKKELREC